MSVAEEVRARRSRVIHAAYAMLGVISHGQIVCSNDFCEAEFHLDALASDLTSPVNDSIMAYDLSLRLAPKYPPQLARDATDAETARCLAIAFEVLKHGPGFDASKEFADGHSTAAQEIAAAIQAKPE